MERIAERMRSRLAVKPAYRRLAHLQGTSAPWRNPRQFVNHPLRPDHGLRRLTVHPRWSRRKSKKRMKRKDSGDTPAAAVPADGCDDVTWRQSMALRRPPPPQ